VYGLTTPSQTEVQVIGKCTEDFAYCLHFEDVWIAPELLEFVDPQDIQVPDPTNLALQQTGLSVAALPLAPAADRRYLVRRCQPRPGSLLGVTVSIEATIG